MSDSKDLKVIIDTTIAAVQAAAAAAVQAAAAATAAASAATAAAETVAAIWAAQNSQGSQDPENPNGGGDDPNSPQTTPGVEAQPEGEQGGVLDMAGDPEFQKLADVPPPGFGHLKNS